MPTTLSPEQVQAKYVAAMPVPMGEAFYNLYNQVAWLYSKWDDYRSTFGDAATVDLLNNTAPTWFHDIQRVLWDSILLHLCRLTDPPQTAGYDNLSLQSLALMFSGVSDLAFRSSLQSAVNNAVAKTDFARHWRNKQLGHTALPVSAGGKAFTLPVAGKLEVTAAINAVGDAMNCVEQYYMKSKMAWDGPGDAPIGVLGLVHYLRTGLEAQRKADRERSKLE